MADMRKAASLTLFAIAGLFTFGALSDAGFVRPLLATTCHRLPERSFPWAPGLCARCTFFWTGILLCSPLMFFRKLPGSISGGLLLILPLAVDGSLQYLGLYESTNILRLITGLTAGAGLCILLESGVQVH